MEWNNFTHAQRSIANEIANNWMKEADNNYKNKIYSKEDELFLDAIERKGYSKDIEATKKLLKRLQEHG